MLSAHDLIYKLAWEICSLFNYFSIFEFGAIICVKTVKDFIVRLPVFNTFKMEDWKIGKKSAYYYMQKNYIKFNAL